MNEGSFKLTFLQIFFHREKKTHLQRLEYKHENQL